jgi:hypothetical protein
MAAAHGTCVAESSGASVYLTEGGLRNVRRTVTLLESNLEISVSIRDVPRIFNAVHGDLAEKRRSLPPNYIRGRPGTRKIATSQDGGPTTSEDPRQPGRNKSDAADHTVISLAKS